MPMIDVYAAEGTFSDRKALAKDLASAVMRWEGVPEISLFKDNTAAFVHELPADALSNVSGDSNYVRVQILTPVGVLDRTWVLIHESPEGGWGIDGHAHTSADIVAAARRELAGANAGPSGRLCS